MHGPHRAPSAVGALLIVCTACVAQVKLCELRMAKSQGLLEEARQVVSGGGVGRVRAADDFESGGPSRYVPSAAAAARPRRSTSDDGGDVGSQNSDEDEEDDEAWVEAH